MIDAQNARTTRDATCYFVDRCLCDLIDDLGSWILLPACYLLPVEVELATS